jgi:hypothetical protein
LLFQHGQSFPSQIPKEIQIDASGATVAVDRVCSQPNVKFQVFEPYQMGQRRAPPGSFGPSSLGKAALKTNTEEAVARGVFGAPTVFVGEAMFFGQDRLDFVREALA